MTKTNELEKIADRKIGPHLEGLSSRDRVMQMLGAAKYADRLRAQSQSQVMQFLMEVEDEKLYIAYGHDSFAGFLDNCGLTGMSKSSFYRLRELYLKEGPEQYDLFSSWKIPMSTRKLLSDGDIVIDGDEIVVGGEERISLTNSGSIKTIIETLVREKHRATEDFAKSVATVERQQLKLEKAGVDNEALQSQIDAMNTATPYEAALSGLLTSFMQLGAVVSCMEPEDREDRVEPDFRTFNHHMRELKEAYGFARWQIKMRDIEERKAAETRKRDLEGLFSMDQSYSHDDILRIANDNGLVLTDCLEDAIPNLTLAIDDEGDPVWQFEAGPNDVFHLVFEDLEAV